MGDAPERNGILVLYGHFKIISGLQLELIAYHSRQDDLAILRQNCGHGKNAYRKLGVCQSGMTTARKALSLRIIDSSLATADLSPPPLADPHITNSFLA